MVQGHTKRFVNASHLPGICSALSQTRLPCNWTCSLLRVPKVIILVVRGNLEDRSSPSDYAARKAVCAPACMMGSSTTCGQSTALTSTRGCESTKSAPWSCPEEPHSSGTEASLAFSSCLSSRRLRASMASVAQVRQSPPMDARGRCAYLANVALSCRYMLPRLSIVLPIPTDWMSLFSSRTFYEEQRKRQNDSYFYVDEKTPESNADTC
jgi:hypothetical protein